MKKEKKGLTLKQTVSNNLFAVRTIWRLCPSLVIHKGLERATGIGTWVFFSAFFIRYIVNSIESNRAFHEIVGYIILVSIAMILITTYATYARNVIFPTKNVEVYQKLYKELYEKAENMELACFEDSKFYNRYTMALDNAGEKMLTIVGEVFGIVLCTMGGMVAYTTMFSIDKWMLVFIIAPILGNFLFGTLVNKLNFRIYQESTPYNRRIEYVNRVMYLADYSKEMRLSDIYKVLNRTYSDAVKGMIQTVKKYMIKSMVYGFNQYYFSYTIIFEGVLLYGAYLAIVKKSITLGELSILASVMSTAAWILVVLGQALMRCSEYGMFMHNIRTFMEYEEEIPEDYDGDLPEGQIKSIEFRSVTFAYRGNEPVIRDLSFTIQGGSSVAFVGHNGAGKTTIIKLLFRLYDPTEGVILVNGRDIKEYNLQAYRDLFAAAFQDYKIMASSVKDNVLMGREVPEEDTVVAEALKRAGIYEKVCSLPNGMNTILTKEFDEQGEVLSGGQFQKIVVARAFANAAPIKVFDEPSSALDPIAEHELFESIIEESKNNTMIYISHRLSSVKNADKVFMLEEGQLIEQGTHEQLYGRNGKYADMYHKQAKNYQPDMAWGEGV